MESTDRRSFFRSLVVGGAAVTDTLHGLPLKHRKADKLRGTRLYHGPMLIPPDVAEVIREEPDLHRTRERKLVSRYAEDGITWLFRCQIPASRAMVGEVVRTPEGAYRVHCWSAATSARRDARELIKNRSLATEQEFTPEKEPFNPNQLDRLMELMSGWSDDDRAAYRS
jgi:hypothetical protein